MNKLLLSACIVFCDDPQRPYAANTYVNDQFDLETYLGCAECEVTDEHAALGLHARWGAAATTISKMSVIDCAYHFF